MTIDPRRIELADYGVLHLSPRPGTNAAVVLGLAHVARSATGSPTRDFIAARTEGYDALDELLDAYTPDAVERDHRHPGRRHRARRAHLRRGRERAACSWGLGVTEHKYGSEVVRLLCNLALMTGKVGRAGLGAAAAARPEQRPGLLGHGRAARHLHAPTARSPTRTVAQSFEQALGRAAEPRRGATRSRRCSTPPSPATSRRCTSSARTSPRPTRTRRTSSRALESLEFLVCQDIFETETTKYADVVLPASAFLEKTGTFTNAERRFQLVDAGDRPARRGARPTSRSSPPSRGRSATRWATRRRADVMDEIAALTPEYAGVSHERVGRTGLQWPVAADGTDSPILYETRVHDCPAARRSSPRCPYKPPGDAADDEFPLILVTGRRLAALQRRHDDAPHRATSSCSTGEWLEIHPDDAARLWICRRRHRLRAQPRRADRASRRSVTERIEPGHVFTAFHFPEVRTNLLVGASADVNTSCPEYKVVAVVVRAGPRARLRRRPRRDARRSGAAHDRGRRPRRRSATRWRSRSRWRSASTTRRWR